ncbi:MAG: SH3 domain-containing protein [Treponema sp.]|nr:SH3 domain-containing protein [Treponema sp.]
MKRILTAITFFMALTVLFADTSKFYNEYNQLLPGMHVDTKNGLDVYSNPSFSSEKLATLSHADYVLIREVGAEETIDGVTGPWVKIVLYPENWKNADKEEYGWVFGENLTPALPEFTNIPDVLAEIQKRGKLYSSFFPSSFGKKYVTNVYLSQETNWLWTEYVSYDAMLERLYCESNQNKIAVTLHDCMVFNKPAGNNPYGTLTVLKEGTKIKLESITAYGVQSSTLYPIYTASEIYNDGSTRYVGEVRGIDITDERCFSSVSDGKGGKMMLAYLRAVKNEDGRSIQKRKDIFEKRFCDLNAPVPSGYKMITAIFTDAEGNKYNLQNLTPELNPEAMRSLRYPLIMKEPVLLLEEIYEKYGITRTNLYTLEYWPSSWGNETSMNYICGYEYKNSGDGETGLGYHCYTSRDVLTYVFQKSNGKVVKDETTTFYQEEYEPYKFHEYTTHYGEPYSIQYWDLKVGIYVNPICRLKMRSSPNLNANKIGTLAPGTILKIIEVGEDAEIDGDKSKWVKVQLVNDVYFVDGARTTAGTTGWVFGAYLH